MGMIAVFRPIYIVKRVEVGLLFKFQPVEGAELLFALVLSTQSCDVL